jgi:hypothetical protein
LSRALAESQGPWKVLSPKYGLVSPDTELEPYEPRKVRTDWYEQIALSLLALTEPGETVTLLSPSPSTADSLSLPLDQANRPLVAPLKGMTLDQQVLWLEETLQAAGLPVPGSRQRSHEEKKARRERRAARRGA